MEELSSTIAAWFPAFGRYGTENQSRYKLSRVTSVNIVILRECEQFQELLEEEW